MRPSEEKKKNAAKLAYRWCCENLKKSKYHTNYPRIIIISKKIGKLRGYYKEKKNLIVIYTKNHRSILDICRTIIHEWKHYQQDVMKMYDTYIVKYGRNFKNHPYEITAENFAIKHSSECKKWILSIAKNK